MMILLENTLNNTFFQQKTHKNDKKLTKCDKKLDKYEICGIIKAIKSKGV